MPKEVNKLAENMRRMFMMFFKGRESIMDFRKKSKHVSSGAIVPFTPNTIKFSIEAYNNLWNSKARKLGDIKGFDEPFGQIGVRTKIGRSAWFSFTGKSEKNKDIATHITNNIINKFFEPSEIRKMDFLGINVGKAQEIEKFAGEPYAAFTTTHPFTLGGKRRQYSQIALQGRYARSAPVVTHELIHTIYEVADRDLDEIVTELDTLRRTKAVDKYAESDSGYYAYFGYKYGLHKSELKKLIREDLKLLENCSSWEDVRRIATQTNLYKLAKGRIRGSNILKGCVENIDRYFIIKDGKREVKIHVRGKAKSRGIPAIVKKWMKKKGVKVYEWKDGKKVRLK